jgi:hypothetical protein
MMEIDYCNMMLTSRVIYREGKRYAPNKGPA